MIGKWQDCQIAGTRRYANGRAAERKLFVAPKLIAWGFLRIHCIDAIRSQVLSEAWLHMDAVHRLNVSRGAFQAAHKI